MAEIPLWPGDCACGVAPGPVATQLSAAGCSGPWKIDLLTKAQGTGVANGRPTESSAGSEKTAEVAVLALVMAIGHVQQLLCSAPASGQIYSYLKLSHRLWHEGIDSSPEAKAKTKLLSWP